MGISIEVNDETPVITQKIFNDEGISFVSFTYQSTWNGQIEDMQLLTEEISEAAWFTKEEALTNAVSLFDAEAIKHHG